MAKARLTAFVTLCVALAKTGPLFGFPSSRLVYVRGQGAESCADEVVVRKAVAARLGYDPFFPSADKTIVVQIVRRSDELHGDVQLVDQRGMVRGLREFKVASGQCNELVATMALAISIAIDPTAESSLPASSSPAPDETSPHTESPQAPAPVAVAHPPSADAAEDRPPPRAAKPSPVALIAGASVTSTVGSQPNPTVGGALSIGVRGGPFSVSLEGRGDLPSSKDVPSGGAVSASVWQTSIVPCLHSRVLFVCAVGSVGWLHGEGVGLQRSTGANALYVAGGARLGGDLPLAGRWFFRPAIDVLATPTRNELSVDGALQWKAPPFSAVLGAGVVARFP